MAKNGLFKLAIDYSKHTATYIILISGFDDNGQLLKNLLNVSLPSVCGILRSDSSGTQHCGKDKGGGRRRELDFNLADAIVLEVRILPPYRWVTAAGVAGALCSM